MSEKPSLDRFIKSWISECGEARTSDHGTKYVIIPTQRMHESLRILAKTLLDAGFSFDELDSARVAVKIADLVWRESKITRMSATEIRKAKLGVTEDWGIALGEFSGITFAKDVEPLEVVEAPKIEKKEKVLELNPSDRIKMDTSDVVDPEKDLEFLKELGVEDE